MKYFKLLPILLFSCAIFLFACNSNSEAGKQEEDKESTIISDPPAMPDATTTQEPAQNAAGVWHYTCSKGCPGGSGTAGNCATCGGPLAHNSAYHSNTNSSPTTSPTIPSPTPPSPAEPAQNAAGVWHYTCSKGCPGGSGTAGNCSNCGGPLTHNTAYHQ
ncbi:MAG: hypothetical protein IPM47_10345 [Sphingobacteriales bacterium]|nr:MAG: hypothetical protein IPM47_10345 [Sphingobacteriales bacterium]